MESIHVGIMPYPAAMHKAWHSIQMNAVSLGVLTRRGSSRQQAERTLLEC